MRYRLQRHDGTDCSATMVPITVLRMVPIQRYRHHSVEVSPPFMRILTRKKLENALLYTKLERSIKREYIADSKHIM